YLLDAVPICWLFGCDETGARDIRVDGLHVFERGPAGWVQTISRSKFMNQGMDLGFDGTNLLVAFDGSGALALARDAAGTWTDPGLRMRSLGMPYVDDE